MNTTTRVIGRDILVCDPPKGSASRYRNSAKRKNGPARRSRSRSRATEPRSRVRHPSEWTIAGWSLLTRNPSCKKALDHLRGFKRMF
jgi:hypothetical protein